MTHVIYKYILPIRDTVTRDIPVGARFLEVAIQRENLCVWAMVDREAQIIPRTFCIVGTGHVIPEGSYDYLGTAHHAGGGVWHVLIRRTDDAMAMLDQAMTSRAEPATLVNVPASPVHACTLCKGKGRVQDGYYGGMVVGPAYPCPACTPKVSR